MGRLFLMLFVTCLLAGCSSDDDGDNGDNGGNGEEKHITVANEGQLTQTVYADQTTGNSTVNFTTTDMWTSSITQPKGGKPDWISMTPEYGYVGQHAISFILDENYTGEKRTATISIVCDGETVTITVHQEATTQSGAKLKHVTGVTMDKKTLTLTVGDSETLTATVEPSDATNKRVEWKSSNTSIATVDAEGKVTAVAKGSTRIYATSVDDETKSDYCEVKVNKPVQGTLTVNGTHTYNFESIRVSCGKPPLGSGYIVQYIATSTLEDLTTIQFSFAIFFDEKKMSPVPGTFTVGSIAHLANNVIYSTTITVPAWISSLQEGVKVYVESGADVVSVSCSGATKNGNTVHFSYAGTYELFIEPGM